MGLADTASDLAVSVTREAMRPARALDRRLRPSAERAALDALDRVLDSPVTAIAVDRIVRSPR